MKMRRLWEGQLLYGIGVLVFLAMFLTALVTRPSIKPAEQLTQAVNGYTAELVPLTAESAADALPAAREAQAGAVPLVILGRCADVRQYVNQGRETWVTVEKVYRGDQALRGRKILVDEWLNVLPQRKSIGCDVGYIPMLSERRYVLLLKPKSFFPEQKRLTPEERETYYLWGLQQHRYIFSKFTYGRDVPRQAPATTLTRISWDRLPDAEVLVDSEKTRAQFYQIKASVLKAYKITD